MQDVTCFSGIVRNARNGLDFNIMFPTQLRLRIYVSTYLCTMPFGLCNFTHRVHNNDIIIIDGELDPDTPLTKVAQAGVYPAAQRIRLR